MYKKGLLFVCFCFVLILCSMEISAVNYVVDNDSLDNYYGWHKANNFEIVGTGLYYNLSDSSGSQDLADYVIITPVLNLTCLSSSTSCCSSFCSASGFDAVKANYICWNISEVYFNYLNFSADYTTGGFSGWYQQYLRWFTYDKLGGELMQGTAYFNETGNSINYSYTFNDSIRENGETFCVRYYAAAGGAAGVYWQRGTILEFNFDMVRRDACLEFEYWNGSHCLSCPTVKTNFDDDFKNVIGKKSAGDIWHFYKGTDNDVYDNNLEVDIVGSDHPTMPLEYDFDSWDYTVYGSYYWLNFRKKVFVVPFSHYNVIQQMQYISDSYWETNSKIINKTSFCTLYNVDKVYNFTDCLFGICIQYLDIYTVIEEDDINVGVEKVGNQTYNETVVIEPIPSTVLMNGTTIIYNNVGTPIISNTHDGTYDSVNDVYTFNNTELNLTSLNESLNYTFENIFTGFSLLGNITQQYGFSGILYFNSNDTEWFILDPLTNNTFDLSDSTLNKTGYKVAQYIEAGVKDGSITDFFETIPGVTPEDGFVFPIAFILLILLILIVIYFISRFIK